LGTFFSKGNIKKFNEKSVLLIQVLFEKVWLNIRLLLQLNDFKLNLLVAKSLLKIFSLENLKLTHLLKLRRRRKLLIAYFFIEKCWKKSFMILCFFMILFL